MADVLLVEDVPLQATLIREFLRNRHTIRWTRTADEAVSSVRETDPDVVVMDLNLEGKSGINATQEIKSIENEIPIIVSTGLVSEEIKSQVREAGADAYLAKPYTEDELLETLDRLCCEFCYPAYDYYD